MRLLTASPSAVSAAIYGLCLAEASLIPGDGMHDLYAPTEHSLHFQIDQGSFHRIGRPRTFGHKKITFRLSWAQQRSQCVRGNSRTETVPLTDGGHDERNKRKIKELPPFGLVLCRIQMPAVSYPSDEESFARDNQ